MSLVRSFFCDKRRFSLICILVPPRLSVIPPMEINYDPQHPQRVSFQCRMERGSVDGLTMEWQYLNNTPVQSTNGISIDKTQLETNKLIELHFNPVQREHFGNYSCVAKNLADSTYSIASLLIKCKFIRLIIAEKGFMINFSPTNLCRTEY